MASMEKVGVKASGPPAFTVRRATAADRDGWIKMRVVLWPDGPRFEQEREVDATLASATHAALIAESLDGELCGFVEATLREFAMGCTTKPIGYVEGWYVQPTFHRRGVGRALINAVEHWAMQKGGQEMESDTTIGMPLATKHIGRSAMKRAGGSFATEKAWWSRVNFTKTCV